MSLSLAGSLGMAALLSAVLGRAAPDLAWRGGDAVEVAPHRMGLIRSHSNEPLLGYLAKPDTPGRHPAVVVLHGCIGFWLSDGVWAEVLKSYGYVALALDSLDESDVCGRQGDVAEAFDAYAALGWLARQNFVGSRSRRFARPLDGRHATLDSVEVGVGALEKAEKRHFRAAIAYYPNCLQRAGVMTVPTLILIGDKDDWTLASRCRNMMARRNGRDAPVTLIIYPGATHAFNVPAFNVPFAGHRFAYDSQATADAWKEVRNFLRTTLGGAQPAGNKPPSGPAAASR